ncbi:MAG TPA: leucine-rich repeat domain-containing protein [Phototrophicaceae bacterium]|nr:leucine-rich repeat domain-containing protein [Phototrophicaceae bacterium]
MRRFVALLCVLLALAAAVPTRASPAAQTFDCNSVTEIPTLECQALIALYTSTNGSGWANHTNWETTTTPCSWYGVVCSSGHVTQLNLYTNQLSGRLPSELGSLTYLRYFRLYDNQLSGALPPQLGNLTSLQRIYLQFNQLSGTIPPELGNLSQLEVLNLSDNRLEGTIPPELGSLTNLRQLWLHDNQLSGEIPATLVNLTLLDDIFNDLSSNCLTASDPTLLNFLASKAPNWANTQTIPPHQSPVSRFFGADECYPPVDADNLHVGCRLLSPQLRDQSERAVYGGKRPHGQQNHYQLYLYWPESE